MELPKRKPQRLSGFDYSQSNAYFITICTQNKLNLFGELINNSIELNDAGKMIREKIKSISGMGVIVDKYVIMPNHIHAIIIINNNGTAQGPFPTLSETVLRFKTITTKLYIDGVKNGAYLPFEKKIWQKSFYDHIIRDENGYLAIWKYIDENPLQWQDDEYNVLN